MMLATNSFDIPNGMDTYPDLLEASGYIMSI